MLKMAEANLEDTPEVCERFEEAANHVPALLGKLDQGTLLKLYALYKQASVGTCDTPQPGWFQMQAKKKWDAWKELGDMTRATAMIRYTELVEQADPNWERSRGGGTKGWVAVSSMADTDPAIADSDKDIFDHVKEGDVGRVRAAAAKGEGAQLARLRDLDGMGLVHWAADRGNVEMLRVLATELGVDLGAADGDGQTALHYAAACGHTDVVRYLLENGADPNASDGGGLVPSDVASETNIEDLLNKRSK